MTGAPFASPIVRVATPAAVPVLKVSSQAPAAVVRDVSLGPVGPPGPSGSGSGGLPQQVYPISNAASFTANHGRSDQPDILLLLPSGEQVETDVYRAPGQVTIVFAQPFTGTLLLG